MEGAQAKALYGLTINYTALSALVEALLERDTLTGVEVRQIMAEHNAISFPDPYVAGFGWDDDGLITFPGLAQASALTHLDCDHGH